MRSWVWSLGFAAVLSGGAGALAQDEGAADALAQMPLTDTLIQQFLAASPVVEEAMKAAPPGDAEAPDPQLVAKLEQIAKTYKFANFGQFDTVAGNIMLVLQGVDPRAKRYIGAEAELKQEIAALQANSQIPADDKKAEIGELDQELKDVVPVKFKANIDLVLKYYDKLASLEGEAP